jgi:hypothetical protein
VARSIMTVSRRLTAFSRRLTAVAFGLVLLAAACGDSGDPAPGGSPAGAGSSGTATGGRGGGSGGGSGVGGAAASGGAGGSGGSAGAGGTGGTGGGSSDARGGDRASRADVGGGGDSAAPPAAPDPSGWTLRWSGLGSREGLGMFEGQETADCAHGGGPHASVVDGNVRIDMHTNDTDCNGRGDRARNEVKGMSAPAGGYVAMKRGETWLQTWSMFIPATLIHQIFAVQGTSAVTGPVITMSLHQHAGVDAIELRIDGTSGPHTAPTPLAPIQNRWVTVEFEIKWDNPGTLRWSIKDDQQTYVNHTRAWDGWHGSERMRPKWGIYRSKGSAGLQNTYILLNNFKAYQK